MHFSLLPADDLTAVCLAAPGTVNSTPWCLCASLVVSAGSPPPPHVTYVILGTLVSDKFRGPPILLAWSCALRTTGLQYALVDLQIKCWTVERNLITLITVSVENECNVAKQS